MPSEEQKDKRALSTEARNVIQRAYERGIEAGRVAGRREGLEKSKREALLSAHTEQLESAAKQVDDELAKAAFKEAASILRDLQEAEQGSKTVTRQAVSG